MMGIMEEFYGPEARKEDEEQGMEKVKGEDDASYELWKKRGRMGAFTVIICMFISLLIAALLLYVGYRWEKHLRAWVRLSRFLLSTVVSRSV